MKIRKFLDWTLVDTGVLTIFSLFFFLLVFFLPYIGGLIAGSLMGFYLGEINKSNFQPVAVRPVIVVIFLMPALIAFLVGAWRTDVSQGLFCGSFSLLATIFVYIATRIFPIKP